MQENYKNEYKSGEIELSIPSMIKTVYVKPCFLEETTILVCKTSQLSMLKSKYKGHTRGCQIVDRNLQILAANKQRI